MEKETERKSLMKKELWNWFNQEGKWDNIRSLASDIGIPYSSLSAYFRGEKFPSDKNCRKLYEFSSLGIFRDSEISEQIELEKVLDHIEDIYSRIGLLADLLRSSKSNSNVENSFFSSQKETSLPDRIRAIKKLLLLLNKELDYFKKSTPEDRKAFGNSISHLDVGYLIALLKALFDEDRFQNWLFMTTYEFGDDKNGKD